MATQAKETKGGTKKEEVKEEAKAEEVKEVKDIPKIKPQHVVEAEHSFARYSVTALFGVTLEEMLKPDLWSSVGHRFKSGDEIRIISEDRSWMANCFVRFASRVRVELTVLEKYELEVAQMEQTVINGYSCKWNGSLDMFTVFTPEDEKVKGGFNTLNEAIMFASQYFNKVA
jgi:hypothetical protein